MMMETDNFEEMDYQQVLIDYENALETLGKISQQRKLVQEHPGFKKKALLKWQMGKLTTKVVEDAKHKVWISLGLSCDLCSR